MSIYYRIDGILINQLLTDGHREAGIYAAGYRIYDAISNILILFGNILLPLYARYSDNKIMLTQLSKYAFYCVLFICVFTILTGYYFRFDVIDLLYHRQDIYWVQIYLLLLGSILGIGSVYIYGSLLTAAGKIKTINIMVSIGVMVNVGLNLYLIPEYKALGAAMSFLITQSLMGVLHFIYGRKYLTSL